MKRVLASLLIGGGLAVVATGCIATDDSTSADGLTTRHFVDRGDAVFELQMFDTHQQELGQVVARTGTIDGLRDAIGGDDDVGSEVVVTVDGNATRLLTHATGEFPIGPLVDPAAQSFVELDPVTSALDREAHVIVIPAPVAPPEVGFTTETCPGSVLLTSPAAENCCYQTTATRNTTFQLGSGDTARLIRRYQNPYGTGCKASNGTGTCTGKNCYYGPYGFSAPTTQYPPPALPFIKIYDSSAMCSYSFSNVYQSPNFGTLNGSEARGQGCPGGNSGGYFDYF